MSVIQLSDKQLQDLKEHFKLCIENAILTHAGACPYGKSNIDANTHNEDHVKLQGQSKMREYLLVAVISSGTSLIFGWVGAIVLKKFI